MADPIIFVIFLHGHKSNPMIPAAFFSTHLDGKHQSMKLNLTSDASNKTWEVKLDGRSFGDGWEDFSAVHCLRDDDVLVFRDKGDMSFHVTPSGRSFCPVQCIFSEEDDIWDDGSDSKNIASKKKPRMEAESSSENSYLVGHVTSSNLSRDTLCLLRGFSRSNGLNERCCDLDLMNQHGKTWTLGLRYNRTNDQACIRGGWRDFCFANGLEAGSLYRFKLVQNGTRPLLRLCSDTIPKGSCSKANGKHQLSEKSSSDYSESASMKQNKFLTITFKPYMLNSGQLRLPRPFARENEIKEAGEITLVDKYGVKKWPSYLAPANEQGEFYMAKGWRSFCSANRLETGESFTLEFVRGEGTTPMLKFCSKAKIEQAPFDSPRGTGQASWDEEEEGQEETENRVQKRARLSEKGGPPSRRSLASNKSSDDPGNLQSKQPLQHCSISDQVKQSIVVTLSGVRRIQLELEIKEQNLEASLEEINALEEKVMEINKIFNSHKI